MKIIYYNIAALGLIFGIFIAMFVNKFVKGRSGWRYVICLFVVLLATVADIFAVHADNIGGAPYQFISHWFYMLFHFLTSIAYLFYVISLTGTYLQSVNKVKIALVSIPAFGAIGALVATFFAPIVFKVENGIYERQNGLYILYGATAFYMLIGVIFIIKNRKVFDKKTFIAIMSLFPMVAASVLYEFFYKEQIIELFVNALVMMFVLMAVQKPSELIHPTIGAFTHNVLMQDLNKAEVMHSDIRIVCINVYNYAFLDTIFDHANMNKILSLITGRIYSSLRKTRIFGNVYYSGNGLFVAIIDCPDYFNKIDEFARNAQADLNSSLKFDETFIQFQTSICIIDWPEDIDTANKYLTFSTQMQPYLNTNEILKFNELKNHIKDFEIRLKIDSIVKDAVEKKKFRVYYQPIWSVDEQRFVAAEALLRLNDEQFGFINPEIIVNSAERTGLIHLIGLCVIELTCQFLADPRVKALNLDHVHVNLSVMQCMSKDLTGKISEIVDKYGLNHKIINFEITETCLGDESNKILEDNISELTNAGFDISVDDFGSGYSNLARLFKLPAHVIKLDRSLIIVSESQKQQKLLAPIVDLISNMNCRIVAEGVETEEQRKIVESLGCQLIQGYYYSKPLPGEEFIKLVSKS